MYTPYNPCDECKQKAMCSKCAYHNITTNYIRALDKLRELCDELNKPLTILK